MAITDRRKAAPEASADERTDIARELARLRTLSVEAFDAEFKAFAERKRKLLATRDGLRQEDQRIETRVERNEEAVAEGRDSLDVAALAKLKTRREEIAYELRQVAGALEALETAAAPALANAKANRAEAWRRLHAQAVLAFDAALEQARRRNDLLHAIEQAAHPIVTQNVVPSLAWHELRPNQGGEYRLKSWRAFVNREAPHVPLSDSDE